MSDLTNFFVEYKEWICFNLAVISLLVLDLGLLNRNAHVIKLKEALLWSAFWIALGLSFGLYILWTRDTNRALEFYTAYIVEESLSVDNLFVFAIIFETFMIERKHQHRLLFWGILGAIVMRAAMILAGSSLLESFHFVMYIFGAILVATGLKFLFKGDGKHFDPKKSHVYRSAKRILPITDIPHGGHFIKRDPQTGTRAFTLYFIALLVIESTDVIFAVDSVPAVLAISRDPFVVYTSNICAILGLRSLFFVLEDMIDRFHYLQPALGVILCYVGSKMLIEKWIHIPVLVNLSVILGTLLIAVLLSYRANKKKK
jgi:tellurite resistance protein TerC